MSDESPVTVSSADVIDDLVRQIAEQARTIAVLRVQLKQSQEHQDGRTPPAQQR